MKSLLTLIILAGCANVSGTTAPEQPPAMLQVCPDDVTVPPLPPRVRTVERIGEYANQLAVALKASRASRAECARRLDLRNAWKGGGK